MDLPLNENLNLLDIDDPNPFLIEPILMVLMRNMSLSDLKNALLVSSVWDQKAVDCLEQKSTHNEDNKIQILQIDQYFNSISRLYKEVENRQILPGFDLDFDFYQKILSINPQMDILNDFKVVNLTLNSINLKIVDWPIILHNLEKVHKSVRKLKITSVKRGANPNFKKTEEKIEGQDLDQGQIVKNIEFKLLKLKEFSFDSFYIGGRLFDDSSFKFLISIMDLSPQLGIIRIDSFPISQGVFQMLITSSFIKISKLEIRDWFFIPHEMNFYDFGFLHLKELIVQNVYTRNCDDITVFNVFLQTQASTLESLYINMNINSPTTSSKIKFPLCQNLKKLTINWSDRNENQVPIEPINFSVLFPKLLYFQTNQIGNMDMWIGSSDIVKYLKIENWSDNVGIDKLFPNLQVLEADRIFNLFNPNPVCRSFMIKKLIFNVSHKEDLNLVNSRMDYLKELQVLDIGIPPAAAFHQNAENFEDFFKFLKSWINDMNLNRLKTIHLRIIDDSITTHKQHSEDHKRILTKNIEKFEKELSIQVHIRYTN